MLDIWCTVVCIVGFLKEEEEVVEQLGNCVFMRKRVSQSSGFGCGGGAGSIVTVVVGEPLSQGGFFFFLFFWFLLKQEHNCCKFHFK